MDINIKGLRDLSEKQLLIVSVSVIALVVIAMGLVIYFGYSEIGKLEKEKTEANKEAQTFKNTAEKKAEIEKSLAKGEEYLKKYYGKWVLSEEMRKKKLDEIPDLRTYISDIARKAGELTKSYLKVSEFKTVEAKKKSAKGIAPPYEGNAVKFTLEGHAPGVAAFFGLIEQLEYYFVEVTKIKLKASAPKLSKDKSSVETPLHKINVEMRYFKRQTEKFDEKLLKNHTPATALEAYGAGLFKFSDPEEILERSRVVTAVAKEKFMRKMFIPVMRMPVYSDAQTPVEELQWLLGRIQDEATPKESLDKYIKDADALIKKIDSEVANGELSLTPEDTATMSKLKAKYQEILEKMGPRTISPSQKLVGTEETRSEAYKKLLEVWQKNKYSEAIADPKNPAVLKEALNLLNSYQVQDKEQLAKDKKGIFKQEEREWVVARVEQVESILTPPTIGRVSEACKALLKKADEYLAGEDLEIVREGFDEFRAEMFFEEFESEPDKKAIQKYTLLFEARIRELNIIKITKEYEDAIAQIKDLDIKGQYKDALEKGQETSAKLKLALKESDKLPPQALGKLVEYDQKLSAMLAQIDQKYKREQYFATMVERFTPMAIVFMNGKYTALVPYSHEGQPEEGTLTYKWFEVGDEIVYKLAAKKVTGKAAKVATVAMPAGLKIMISDMDAESITFQLADQPGMKKVIKVKPKWDFYKEKQK